LSLLTEFNIKHIFAQHDESSLSLYQKSKKWEIRHALARDERNAVHMANVYAKLAFKPWIAKESRVGSVYMLPGVAEAYKSSTPLIIITTDTPLYGEKMNYMTSLDQTSLFKPITKDTITAFKVEDLPMQ